MKIYDIAIIGGDKRTACMANVLAKKGHNITCYALAERITDACFKTPIYYAETLKEAMDRGKIIVCGIPFEQDGYVNCQKDKTLIPLSELKRRLRKHHMLFAGVISEDFRKMCEEREIACYDFLKEEPITLFNAVATAEGAILEAMLHKDSLLHESNTLVLGYGRCGKTLAQRLLGLYANVTICARNPDDLALANSYGLKTLSIHNLPKEISGYEYIFNTIPYCILNRECLKRTAADSLIIDLASNKTGADYAAAQSLNRQILYCPGLPGKYSQASCGARLADFVIDTCNK